TRSIGPLGAAGIALCLILSLTALPATLVIAGREAFWPFIPRVTGATDTDEARISDHPDASESVEEVPGSRGWQALGRRIAANPRPLWIVSVIALLAMTVGISGADTSLTQEEQLRAKPEA